MKRTCHICGKTKHDTDMVYLGQGVYRCRCHRQSTILKKRDDDEVVEWWEDARKFAYLIR